MTFVVIEGLQAFCKTKCHHLSELTSLGGTRTPKTALECTSDDDIVCMMCTGLRGGEQMRDLVDAAKYGLRDHDARSNSTQSCDASSACLLTEPTYHVAYVAFRKRSC